MTKKQDNIKQLEDRINDLEAQLKRAVADYHNLEKRVQEGRSELTKLGIKDFLIRILPTLDHLDQAVMGAREAGEKSGWLQGVEMSIKELRKALEGEGLTTVQTETFDPNMHEAVEVVDGEDGKILKVLQMGYNLNSNVIRPARVVVGKSQESRVESLGGEDQNTSL